MTVVEFAEVAVLPEPGDNAAIATRPLPAGSVVRLAGREVTLAHPVPEGHRFLVEPVAAGEPLLSWSTPFARARRALCPGGYVCTPTSLAALRARGVTGLPDEPTAENLPLDPYRLDGSASRFGAQATPVDMPGEFLGYPRRHGPAGTRNHIVIVGVTSRAGAFVTEAARRFADAPGAASRRPVDACGGGTGFDGVVPLAHTEAGEDHRPNNAEFVLRVLAGALVHPNTGAVLVVDDPGAAITAADLREFMRAHGYPDVTVPHAFLSRTGGFEADLAAATEMVRPWIAEVAAQRRAARPLSDLRVALQCGGSDAFSGISANPLAGAVAREIIRHGGAAVLAETDELIGAEGYLLDNVRDAEVARAFLRTVEAFKQRVAWHGQTAEANPSGGNVYRGLYNIGLKSLGAARKRDRRVRLDHVIGYGEPLPGPGFTFMDSPGNDLESIAGQVATGCNLIFFTTGNGSITNFPFVPTLKFVTTTARYRLLREEMDVDAGRYLTGTPMDELAAETFEKAVATASGAGTAGERAGHSQVSIWREWRQTRPRPGIAVGADGRTTRPVDQLPRHERDADTDGMPLPVPAAREAPPAAAAGPLSMYAGVGRPVPDLVALVLPTSLCSGQIALRLAEQADRHRWHRQKVTRTVALPHTEGCGVGGGPAEHTFTRTMTGYLAHPYVRMALLLEHGCEKTHNDYFHARLAEQGVDPSRFGWASIQADGGIEAVTRRVREWFEHTAAALPDPRRAPGGLGDLTVALHALGTLAGSTAHALATVGGWIVAAGGTAMLASGGTLLADPEFRRYAFGSPATVAPTLAYGQRPAAPGWHVMRTPTSDWLETATGLGAGGAQVLLAHVAGGTAPGHRLVPVVRVSADPQTGRTRGPDLDAVLRGGAAEQADALLDILVATVSGAATPRSVASGDVGFQVTRGLLGIST